MTYYFAYGSNLNLSQMRSRCPDSAPVSRAILNGHRLAFPRPDSQWRGGVAGIVPDAQSHVEGALYELSEKDVERLDMYEGVAEGEYAHTHVRVELPGSRCATAWTYIAKAEPGGPFAPSSNYLGTILQGARDHGLSDAWIRFLKSFRSAT